MSDSFPSVAELAAEEEELQFSSFTNDDAWELGTALRELARRQGAPVAIDISRNHHQLFRAALPGATPDNDAWIGRKQRVVHRFGHSTLHVRQTFVERGTTFEEQSGLDPQRYAAHGGGFPVLVRSVGPVGVLVVSGLPQLEDHRLIVAALRAHLG
jgi:uncharacterized protein (UPF0303 family)